VVPNPNKYHQPEKEVLQNTNKISWSFKNSLTWANIKDVKLYCNRAAWCLGIGLTPLPSTLESFACYKDNLTRPQNSSSKLSAKSTSLLHRINTKTSQEIMSLLIGASITLCLLGWQWYILRWSNWNSRHLLIILHESRLKYKDLFLNQ